MIWTVIVSRDFLKDLARIPAKTRNRIEDFVFQTLSGAVDPFALGKIEKLQGYEGYHKVRIGDYRIGLAIDKQAGRLALLRVLHRRDIYRHFP